MPPVRTPPWRFVIPGGIVLVGLILAAGLYTRRKEVEATATANNDHALQLLQVKRLLAERIGGDVTRAGQSYGFCRASCDGFFPDGGATRSWQLVAPNAAMLVFLFVREDFSKTLPEYTLKFKWASNREDGDLAPVAPKLQQLLDSLLQRYGFPPDLLTPEPHGRATRGNTTYYGFIERYRPAHGHIYHHTGHESLRGERSVSIIRKRPFAEEGSWLRER